jgi:NifU-like protein involved in Fe-S cluster formation
MEHFKNPRNVGEIENPDGIGHVGNPVCGDIMELYIKVNDGTITDAKFKTFGCGAAIATSSMVTEMVKGKTIEEALKISNRTVAEALGAPLETEDVWVERDYGSAEGLPYDQVRSLLSSSSPASPFQPIFGTGESLWDLHLRATAGVQALVQRPPGRYLVVAHGGVLGAAIRALMGVPASRGSNAVTRILFENTGHATLTYDTPARRWSVRSLNCTCHLPEQGQHP